MNQLKPMIIVLLMLTSALAGCAGTDTTDLEQQIPKIMLKNEKILVTGKGRVGRGVIEMMKKCSIREAEF